MELTEIMIEQLKADLSKAKNYEELMGRDEAIKKAFWSGFTCYSKTSFYLKISKRSIIFVIDL